VTLKVGMMPVGRPPPTHLYHNGLPPNPMQVMPSAAVNIYGQPPPPPPPNSSAVPRVDGPVAETWSDPSSKLSSAAAAAGSVPPGTDHRQVTTKTF